MAGVQPFRQHVVKSKTDASKREIILKQWITPDASASSFILPWIQLHSLAFLGPGFFWMFWDLNASMHRLLKVLLLEQGPSTEIPLGLATLSHS